MTTSHKVFFSPSQSMYQLKDASVDLVVTSPPYPMIEMWDGIMAAQNPKIQEAFDNNQPQVAFELMHVELDAIWKECYRVIKDGGFLCINIGDATRTINGTFRLYNNHSRIVSKCLELGFDNLPNIIWRKQTNAPNKFMGSGMMPCGAYVTLEHEYILVFRKGGKREYKKADDKASRRQSSFFWEERNLWFSDMWDLKGVKQKIENATSRDRNASYPLEVPYRLINMYSQQGDVVLDPFMGFGTTLQASMLLGRHSIGYEIDGTLSKAINEMVTSLEPSDFNKLIIHRFDKHTQFVAERTKTNGALKHFNTKLNCEVMTGQETDIEFHFITDVSSNLSSSADMLEYEVFYEESSDINCPPTSKGTLF